MSTLSVEHLLGIKHLTKEDIYLIFETADHFKQVINRPIKKVPSLRDITIANLFFEILPIPEINPRNKATTKDIKVDKKVIARPGRIKLKALLYSGSE